MHIFKRLFTPPETSFFLFGPRGTGKSTMVRTMYQQALWLDLLQPDLLRRLLARPEHLNELVAARQNLKTIVIDEVQKAPQLLSVVHSLIEARHGLQFILTGSSARKLKQTSANLLGGRALKCSLHPFIASELGAAFDLDKALQIGMLPLVQQSSAPSSTLEAYINLYLHEEIQAEGLVRQLENFARFLEIISFSHASILNITNVARESEIKRKTVENYIGILEDLLLAFTLPVFTKKAQRQLAAHPKFYLFDAGIFNTLRPKGPLDYVAEINGLALEGLVAQHLRAWNDYSQQPHALSYWRTRGGLEVDFIVYGQAGLWAIEVKNSTRRRIEDLKPLLAFQKDYPIAKALILYRGNEILKQQNILYLPCAMFLAHLQPNKTLDEIISELVQL